MEQNLSIFHKLSDLYRDDINPNLVEVLFTQDDFDCAVKLLLNGPLGSTIVLSLSESARQSVTILGMNQIQSPLYFSVHDDIIDNATRFIHLPQYWLCFVSEFFFKEVINRLIVTTHHSQ